eukprot:TRINITY_DN18544_c0_g1_i1.p1 TRINITY_DN18544_c0_g1~~TRINITY_DN18544_c0_g1_i1.p1  ORF type:complete len:267 (+),score=64.74 TRINITY_DN18544_c0_g1_i1:128-928(+)
MGPFSNLVCASCLLACVLFWAPAVEAGPRDVILLNMTIFQTHQLLGDPTVYFQCEDNDTQIYLPDIFDDNQLFSFNGHESFQPLTTLPTDQCKRCGFYDERWLIPDATFAEWELCPLDFAANGTLEKYVRYEFDAIFYCQECSGVQAPAPAPQVPVVLTPTAVPSSLAGAPSNVASPSLVGSNASALPAQPALALPHTSKSSGLSGTMLAVILVIVALCVAGLLLVIVVFYFRKKAKRVHEHEKAVQELAYVEDDLKAGQLEKGLP